MEKLKATHEGTLNIGGADLEVAVLEDGTRVITQSAVFKALDRPVRGNARLINMPVFMDAQNLQPFISEELMAVINKIEYIGVNNKKQEGYDATILPLVSDLYLRAREAKAIKLPSQMETAQKAEILVRSLAKLGITALVDEATGYQYDRERFELQKILNAYISDEILKWQLTFTDDFYKQVYRLWGLPFIPKYIKNKPSFIGNITTKYIYEQLPAGVLDKIREKTGKTAKGNWKYKWHQNLTQEVGREHLKKQIIEVTLLMEMSETKADFEKMFQKKYNKSAQLQFDFKDEPEPLPKLSGFNKNLQQGLNFDPNPTKEK
ncbi:P63C domain-containing protein [Flavobacterium lotistagni]|uniref:P63C domain-containing protein n=1 Tax=Flavobacterium lotistagni TaxID=2709660 RepID=UPI001A9C5249|nr:P63C domain-containing protein [Flavobacterium lotistagni]